MNYKELIDVMTKAKDKAYLGDRKGLEDLEYNLLTLGLLVIDEYKKYKRLYHNIESKKLLEYAKERDKHTSDLQTVKALNKRYMKDIEEKDIAEDSFKVLDKLYQVFDRYAKSLNSTFINEMAQDKRNNTLIANQNIGQKQT